MAERVEQELRKSYPGKGHGADYENSRADAIALKCLSCCSGHRSDVAECRIYDCALWRFRPYGDVNRPDGKVPTREQYAEWSAARAPDMDLEKMRENMAKAHAVRAANRAKEAGE